MSFPKLAVSAALAGLLLAPVGAQAGESLLPNFRLTQLFNRPAPTPPADVDDEGPARGGPSNAELVVTGKADLIIVNVSPADDKGNPKEGATPVVILLQGTSKTTLDKTLDGQKLAAGKYAMNVTMDGKTALVKFEIK